MSSPLCQSLCSGDVVIEYDDGQQRTSLGTTPPPLGTRYRGRSYHQEP